MTLLRRLDPTRPPRPAPVRVEVPGGAAVRGHRQFHQADASRHRVPPAENDRARDCDYLDPMRIADHAVHASAARGCVRAVSYTHLTLPTIYSV